MASAYAVLTLLFTLFGVVATQQPDRLVSPGSSLYPSKQPHSWHSSSRRFQFGFYKQGAGFAVGIWLVTSSEITIVWTANRDDLPVSSNAVLMLTPHGKLILKTEDSKDKLIADTFEPASFASMLDSGNLVLYNNSSNIIWSSFNSPTDTILGGQNLYAGKELLSRVNETDSGIGRFRLYMQSDGNLVLYPTYTLDEGREAYWASGTNNQGEIHLFVNNTGKLQLLYRNMSVVQNLYSDSSLVDNSSAIYRATLGHDGILRFYSHFLVSEGVYNTSVKWKVPDNMCLVKTFCGMNSYCTLYDDQPRCRCLPGTEFVDPNQMSGGCQRNFIEETCKGMNTSTNLYNMTSMEKMTWDDYPYFKADMFEEDCKISCLKDCNCDAVLHESGSTCTKHKLPLKSARRDLGESSPLIAYFKTGKRNITIEDNDDTDHAPVEPPLRIRSKKAIILILVMTVGFILCSCVFLAISGFFIFKHRVVKYQWLLETGSFGSINELTLRSFSYNELKKATNGFAEELGKGSFGAVYKGTLYKGEKPVAVKRLEKMVNDGEREFRAEMYAIGRTHHKNLVRLLGYCTEDSKRLLVYEYMSNGSLADVLFQGAERTPDNWVYKCFIDRELNKLVRGEEVDMKTLENMIKVGLWCVQDEPALRPSMKSVVMMLEGITDISIPPCPAAS